MNRLSEIISLPVISLYESEHLGIINNIVVDSKQKNSLYATIIHEDDYITKVLKIKDIYKIGENCVFIKNSSVLELESNYDSISSNWTNLINIKVYNIDGKYFGHSIDVVLDNKLNIDNIILNDNSYIDKSKLINIGKSAIIIGDNKISIKKLKPKKININNSCNTSDKIMILNKSTTSNNPTKIITDYRMLVGRKIIKDIQSSNGEIIIKNGQTLTKELIKKASNYGKLMEITRYSN